MKEILFAIQKTHRKKSPWTESEDQILLANTATNGKNQWKKISELLQGRTSYDCFLRYRSIKPGLKKGAWSYAEDQKIFEGIELFGKQWSEIAKRFFGGGRNAKQIRERYINYLDPRVKKGKFEIKEDLLILELYKEFGPRWSEIQKRVPQRSADAIKNRFNSSIKRNKALVAYLKIFRDTLLVKFPLISRTISR
jgi:hypothetical protein